MFSEKMILMENHIEPTLTIKCWLDVSVNQWVVGIKKKKTLQIFLKSLFKYPLRDYNYNCNLLLDKALKQQNLLSPTPHPIRTILHYSTNANFDDVQK